MLVAPVVSTFDRQSRQPLVCSALAVAPGVNTRIDASAAPYRVWPGTCPRCPLVLSESVSGRVVVSPSRPLLDERLPYIAPHGRNGDLCAAARRASSALDPCQLLRPGVVTLKMPDRYGPSGSGLHPTLGVPARPEPYAPGGSGLGRPIEL